MKKSLNHFLAFVSILWGAGAVSLITAIWVSAYLHGGSVLVTINSYGEAQIELLMFLIVIPIFAVGTYYALNREM